MYPYYSQYYNPNHPYQNYNMPPYPYYPPVPHYQNNPFMVDPAFQNQMHIPSISY